MKLSKELLFLICFVFFAGCFKQDAPEIVSDQTRTNRDIDQLKACSDITFYEGFLYRKNLVNLFVCTSWDRKFVEMFRALSETTDHHWNSLVAPIDGIFFGDRARRDRFIKYYQDLDNDGALDDLGRVITTLTDTNFYDGLNALFVCAEDPSHKDCKGRKNLVTKDEIKKLLLLLNRDENLLLELSRIVDQFHDALGGDAERLRREIVKFNDTTFFNKLRIMIVTEFAKKYIDGLKDEDVDLLRGFFSAKEPVSDSNWVYQWIQREDVSKNYIDSIVQLPVLKQPQMIRDIKVLNDLYNSSIACSDENLQLAIDIKSLIENTLVHLKSDDIVKFFDTLLLATESISYARPICPDLTDANRVVNYFEYSQRRNVNHKINLSNVLKYSIDLLAKNPTIDLVKFTLELTSYNHEFFMDFLNSDSFNVANEVNRVIVENSGDFYSTVLGILKRSDQQIFHSLAYIMNDLFKEKNSEDLNSWVKSWLFWNEEEQNFLFKFIDIHLDSDTDYVRLFSFYSLFLKEVSTDWSRIGEYYNKDEQSKEVTYQSLKSVFAKFHGEEILGDYKKFFSRDHILELLKVITSGGSFKEDALSRLSIRDVSDVTPVKGPSISLVTRDDNKLSEVRECVNSLSTSSTLVELIENYPSACVGVNDNYVLDDLTLGIKSAFNEYQESFPNSSLDQFFEIGGLLSPEMTLWVISTSVSIDVEMRKNNEGIEDFLDQGRKYLLELGVKTARGVDILKNTLGLTLNWVGSDEDSALRNGIISELVQNKDKADEAFQVIPDVMDDFEVWNSQFRAPVYEEDESYSCRNFLNIHVGRHVCPSVEKVKENVNLLAERMAMRHEASEGVPIQYLLQGALPDEGLQIPLDGKKTKLKKLTLLESFNYLYDLSDKSLKVNREKVKYRDTLNSDKEYYTLTTSERIDQVIRNVSFRHNYLGVQYLNAVVKGDDYTDVVKEKQRLMGLCLNTPGVRCGKSMTKEERRKGKNAFWAYDGLVDVNNGNGLEPRMNYGEFMQAFMYNFVASSALEAQEVKLFPLDDDVLKKHNGKALGYISEMSGFSNMGRVVHDRVGRSRKQFEEFINLPQFKRVNEFILSRVPQSEIYKVGEDLLKSLHIEEDSTLDNLVEWINTLSYNELRIFEEIIAKSLYISTYLGSEEQVFGTGNNEKFSNNTVFESISIGTSIVREFKFLKSSFGEEYLLKNALVPTLNVVSFLYEKLSDNNSVKKYWKVLNLGYASLREVLYVRGAVSNLVENIIKKGRSETVYKLVSNAYDYLLEVEKSGVSDLTKSMRVIYNSSVGIEPFWKYVDGTTVKSYCSVEEEKCLGNSSYDEITKISYVLDRKNNLEKTLNWLLVDQRDALANTANDFLPFLKVIK
ncbi:putative large secreted protein [Halobacteriovorax marinus SJ]|uniref:Large secreted protein n=1 Tax=Halobacteriovorax marinus (strain ATCC BAA-682 / DSM 15412 / SJ) TaxID=862908 RepID=E1X291_HALMS|nr:hypothetical protein [Halobacteriovorax marinus]CBW25047.1 putative large secreted protein [Halobacteriovorax marinus SJ]